MPPVHPITPTSLSKKNLLAIHSHFDLLGGGRTLGTASWWILLAQLSSILQHKYLQHPTTPPSPAYFGSLESGENRWIMGRSEVKSSYINTYIHTYIAWSQSDHCNQEGTSSSTTPRSIDPTINFNFFYQSMITLAILVFLFCFMTFYLFIFRLSSPSWLIHRYRLEYRHPRRYALGPLVTILSLSIDRFLIRSS